MERKLVTIQKIENLEAIPGADRIVVATIMGWNVIVKKDEFSVGDICCFFEVDALLPDGEEWAEFMQARKFRVKTLKMKGVVSQGLALPISILPEKNFFQKLWRKLSGKNVWEVGEDITEILRVTKYDVEAASRGPGFKRGLAAGSFPPFITKTNETRLQSAMGLLREISEHPFYVSVKCDGTSGTFYKIDGELTCCSRNRKVKPGDNVYWDVATKYDLANVLPEGYAIQAEVCGPGIQKNKLMLKEKDLFVFNVFKIKGPEYFGLFDMEEFCKKNGLKTVPIQRVVTTVDDFDCTLSNFLELAKGKYEGTKNNKEGIVVRPLYPVKSRLFRGGRLSFKVINNEYLLKDED